MGQKAVSIHIIKEKLKISLSLYIEDFKLCNPLGTLSFLAKTLLGLLDFE